MGGAWLKRKKGFYRVLIDGRWRVGHWSNDCWRFPLFNDFTRVGEVVETDVDSVDECRIAMPDEVEE